MARMLLDWRPMRTPVPVADPWTAEVDNGWHDLIVSSAPPPVPADAAPAASAAPQFMGGRELATREIRLKNQPLPSDLNTWQEHGATRRGVAEASVVEEPSFSRSDRRMWLIAGSLMGLAALVLGVLGVLSFGGTRVLDGFASSTGTHMLPAARPRTDLVVSAPAMPAAALGTGGVAAAPPQRAVELPEPAAGLVLTTTASHKKHHSTHRKKQPLASAAR